MAILILTVTQIVRVKFLRAKAANRQIIRKGIIKISLSLAKIIRIKYKNSKISLINKRTILI